jgi:hypothetical protein
MTAQRFPCIDAQCNRYARVTVEDAQGERGRACARHAVAALEGLTGARVIWEDTRGISSARPPHCESRRSGPSSPGRDVAA